jgi:hypothetical protein
MVLKEDKKAMGRAIYSMMMAVFIFIVAIILTQPIQEMTELGRDSDHLDCDNSSISTGDKVTCVAIDLYLPAFILALLAGGIAYLSRED